MKARIGLCVLLSLALSALADDFKLLNGKEYKGVTVSKVEPDGLRLMTDAGIEKIPFDQLPPEIGAKYGYDPKKATEYAKTVDANRAAVEQAQARARAAVAQKKALKEREASSQVFRFKVDQVVPGGAIVTPYESYSVGGSDSGVGLGGSVGTSYRLGSKTAFVKGVSAIAGIAEDQALNVLAYRDGVYTFTDTFGASRTVEQWVFVKDSKE